jgi:ABC-type protease/lipase transport system fused ATPase/permease subunit
MSIASHERLSASLRNAEAIRGLGMAGAVRARWQGHHRDAVDLQVTAGETGGLLLAASKVLRLLLQVGILGVGAWLAIRQEISPGVMFAASLIMGRALSPLEQAVGQWRSFVTARAARQRLARLFTEHPPRPARTRLPAPQGRLAVENLAVLAPGTQTPVVRLVGFELEPGDVLAIVGPTGSGKSSLARAIVNAWPAAAGCVRIDGNDVTHYDPDQFGAAIGYLPQDIELFAGSIAENIARFGARDDTAVVAAATAAQAHGLIQRLPGGYETVVGEDGVASPAARSSASPSPARSTGRPASSCSTSPTPTSTGRATPPSSPPWPGSRRAARPSSSSPTSRTCSVSSTRCSSCTRARAARSACATRCCP